MKKRIYEEKKTELLILILIALIGISFVALRFRRAQVYDNMIDVANSYMSEGEYGDAIALYQQSLSYKKNDAVKEKIRNAKAMKEQKRNESNAVKMMKDKKFEEAMDALLKVTEESGKLYEEAQKNIKECRRQIIKTNLENATVAADKGELTKAKEYVDKVIKMDANNQEAIKLKEQYSRDNKKAANTNNTNSTNSTNNTNNTNNKNNKTTSNSKKRTN